MTEALTLTEKSKMQRDNTKNATKNFDYTTIADRLRTVSWGSESHPAGVVKIDQMSIRPPVYTQLII